MKLGAVGRCRACVESDISSVASIHLVAFEGFFLTMLGYKFLYVMYLAFLRSSNSIFVVYETTTGQLAGFAVGVLREQKDRWLAIKFFPQFFVAVASAFFRQPILVFLRLCKRFFYRDELDKLPNDAAVLRSIAVLPCLRGIGAAETILAAFEFMAVDKGANHIYLTTDAVDNDRAQGFYLRCGYQTVARFRQDGKRWMLLMLKSLKRAPDDC